jgi:hypothetical protein
VIDINDSGKPVREAEIGSTEIVTGYYDTSLPTTSIEPFGRRQEKEEPTMRSRRSLIALAPTAVASATHTSDAIPQNGGTCDQPPPVTTRVDMGGDMRHMRHVSWS